MASVAERLHQLHDVVTSDRERIVLILTDERDDVLDQADLHGSRGLAPCAIQARFHEPAEAP
jgi:hypothetical protein